MRHTHTAIIRVEAMRIARQMVKDGIRKAGYKLSCFEVKDITMSAYVLLKEQPEIYRLALRNVKRRDKLISGAKKWESGKRSTG
jgi:hypothetical protein